MNRGQVNNLRLGLVAVIGLLVPVACGGGGSENRTQQSEETVYEARKKLNQMGIEYSGEAFVKAIFMRDDVAVKLFLEAGMNPNLEVDVAKMLEAAKSTPFVSRVKVPVLLIAEVRNQESTSKLLRDAGASVERMLQAKRELLETEQEFLGADSEFANGLKRQQTLLPSFARDEGPAIPGREEQANSNSPDEQSGHKQDVVELPPLNPNTSAVDNDQAHQQDGKKANSIRSLLNDL